MIFIDSSFIIALADEDDQFHARAVEILPKLDGHRSISELVLAESVSAVGSRLGVKAGRAVFENLLYDSSTKTYFSGKRLFERAMTIFAKHGARLSFTDAVSLQLMYDLKIREIASFDADFDHIENVIRIS